MTIIRSLNQDIDSVGSTNQLYIDYKRRWRFYLEAYLGGTEWQDGNHLTRYQLETDAEYRARLRETPLDNHTRSVVSVYNSFLFRREPEREYGTLEGNPELEDFLKDADLEGRSLDAFMKEVATWSNVFGHSFILLTKPNINAVTRADEVANSIRPYVSVLTPLVVLDWSYERLPSGRYAIDAFKYIEDFNDEIRTVKLWTNDIIYTWVHDTKTGKELSSMEEPNQLGYVPVITAYANRSIVRGIGVSNVADIADMQKFIYNCTSEIAQSIRLDSHPSMVTTPDVNIGTGAGALIHMPETLDAGLKPYLLETSGANIDAIYRGIQASIDAIDKMANTGAVRATESRNLSGVAMETEFSLLEAKLSEMADNFELAEEQMWRIWADYQGTTWTGSVEYPDSFNIRDTEKEIRQLQIAASTDPVDSQVKAAIDMRIWQWLDLDDVESDMINGYSAHIMYSPDGQATIVRTEAEHSSLVSQGWTHDHECDCAKTDMNTQSDVYVNGQPLNGDTNASS
jgi:hypothetical protein